MRRVVNGVGHVGKPWQQTVRPSDDDGMQLLPIGHWLG